LERIDDHGSISEDPVGLAPFAIGRFDANFRTRGRAEVGMGPGP